MDELKELLKQFPHYEIKYLVTSPDKGSSFPAVITSAKVVDCVESGGIRFFSKDTYIDYRIKQMTWDSEYEDLDLDELKTTATFECDRLPWKKVILVQLTQEN